jgi:hypothetical protein
MPGAWRSEAGIKSGTIRVPGGLRKERRKGNCKTVYITAC